MDVDALSGRELDAAVAKARGWIKGIRYWMDPNKPDALWGGTGYTTKEWFDYDLPRYRPSSDIAAAWELWQEMSHNASTWDRFIGAIEDVILARLAHHDAVSYVRDLRWLIWFLTPKDIARAYLKVKGSTNDPLAD